jgi:hypothetical protein
MNGAGKWFLARPALKGSGPESSGLTPGPYRPPLLLVSGSTSMSAS